MMVRRFLLFILLLSSIQASALYAESQESSRPLTFSGPRFQVEDLSADFHSDGNLLVVSGKIKNLSFTNVCGYVTVYFKDSHHDVLRAMDVEINENQPIPTGQTAHFETTANIEGIQGLANVSVEFIESVRGLY